MTHNINDQQDGHSKETHDDSQPDPDSGTWNVIPDERVNTEFIEWDGEHNEQDRDGLAGDQVLLGAVRNSQSAL